MTVHEVIPVTRAGNVAARMAAIADEVAAPAAADVDQIGRFPSETLAALRAEGLLAALVPVEFGGGRRVAGRGVRRPGGPRSPVRVERHGGGHAPHPGGLPGPPRPQRPAPGLSPRSSPDHQYLLASATTEVGTGGDVRSSICALEVVDGAVPGTRSRPR